MKEMKEKIFNALMVASGLMWIVVLAAFCQYDVNRPMLLIGGIGSVVTFMSAMYVGLHE